MMRPVGIPGGRALEQAGAAPHLRLDTAAASPGASPIVERVAVRAVARRGDELLMVHSSVAGDFKFPGGGVEPGESLLDALVREVREECGRPLARVHGVVLVVDERRPWTDPGAVLQMRSVYAACSVGAARHEVQLDDYERDLGFRAVWVTPSDALRVNEAVLTSAGAQPWVAREAAVLRHLIDAPDATR